MVERRDVSQNHAGREPLAKISLEELPITADTLLQDNISRLATARRNRFNEDEKNDSQVIIIRCSDSRYILTYRKALSIASIGAGGPKELFAGIYEKKGAPGIIMLPHEHCGGLGVKSVLEEFGLPENPNPVERYAHHHIPDADPLIMAARSAKNVSLIIPNKPILAALHKHETGGIIPFAVYYNGKPSFQEEVPDTFSEFFNYQHKYVASLKSRYPNLAEIQQTQNPELLAITRDDRPLEVTLPHTTRRPGRAFRILSSRPKDGKLWKLDPEDMELIMAQAYYPLTHFNALNRILISTEEMEASLEMATRLNEMPEVKVWMAKPDSTIYIAESKQGIIKNIEEYPLKRAW